MGKKQETNYGAELIREYERWEYLKEYGGSDPFYDDATNMNLVRNHILYAKRQLEEKYGADRSKYPESYFREVPPETERGYMARAAEIRDKAAERLEQYLADENFQYLLWNRDKLGKKDIQKTSIDYVLGYVSGLAGAIKEEDLITMRRHANGKAGYQDSFAQCAEKVKKIIREKELEPSGQVQGGQMTLFQMGLKTGQCR